MTWLFAETAKVGTAFRKASAKANVKTNALRVRGEIVRWGKPKPSSVLLTLSDLNHAVASECGLPHCR
jgi:hypothetical protein